MSNVIITFKSVVYEPSVSSVEGGKMPLTSRQIKPSLAVAY